MSHAEEKQFDPAVLGEPGAGLYERIQLNNAALSGMRDRIAQEGKAVSADQFADLIEENSQALAAARAHAASPALVDAARVLNRAEQFISDFFHFHDNRTRDTCCDPDAECSIAMGEYIEHEDRVMLEDIRTTLAAWRAHGGWRDIGTAPLSEERKKIWVIGGHYEAPTLVNSDREWWLVPAAKGGLMYPPTHWHPQYIPPPPEDRNG